MYPGWTPQQPICCKSCGSKGRELASGLQAAGPALFCSEVLLLNRLLQTEKAPALDGAGAFFRPAHGRRCVQADGLFNDQLLRGAAGFFGQCQQQHAVFVFGLGRRLVDICR